MSVRKNYIFNVLLSGVNLLYPLITFPYVARVLQPEGLGQAQFTFNFALYFSVIAAFGIPFYGIKEIGRSRSTEKDLNKTFSELFTISSITSIFCLVIYLLSIIALPAIEINWELGLIAGFLIFLTPLNLDWVFSGLEEFKLIAQRAICIKVIALVLLFTLVKDSSDVALYLSILTFSYVGNYLMNLLLIRKRVSFSFSNLNLRKHQKPLLFILSSSFATTIYTSLDSVVLGLLTDDYEVGIYAAAVKLAKVSLPIVTGLSAVIMPKIALAIKEKDLLYERSMINKSFSFIVFLGIPISMGLFIFSEEFILLLSGVTYLQSVSSMMYLSFLPFFIGLGYLFGFQVLVPNNLNIGLFTSTLLGVIVFVISNYLFTQEMGAKGTAISVLLTEITVTGSYLLHCPRNLTSGLPYRELFFALLSTVFFYPILLWIDFLAGTLFIKVGIAILLSAISYFSLQFFFFNNEIIKTFIHSIKTKIKP